MCLYYSYSLDLYHSLHCLVCTYCLSSSSRKLFTKQNAIRRALDSDYYEPGVEHPYFFRLHIGMDFQ
jgi:hypothetical protein